MGSQLARWRAPPPGGDPRHGQRPLSRAVRHRRPDLGRLLGLLRRRGGSCGHGRPRAGRDHRARARVPGASGGRVGPLGRHRAALLVTEFGDWGLPDLPAREASPFWHQEDVIARDLSGTPWPGTPAEFVAGRQRSQGPADRLQAEVFRRHDHLGGYRVTELNGLLTSPTTWCCGCRRRADRITAAFRERSPGVIEAAQAVTGHPIPSLDTPRRAGDPPILVASSHLMANELGWAPEKPQLTTMIVDAWAWMRASAVENAEWPS